MSRRLLRECRWQPQRRAAATTAISRGAVAMPHGTASPLAVMHHDLRRVPIDRPHVRTGAAEIRLLASLRLRKNGSFLSNQASGSTLGVHAAIIPQRNACKSLIGHLQFRPLMLAAAS